MDRISSARALELIMSAASPAGAVDTPLERALGRTLVHDVRVGLDVPAFEQSAMDGYAVRAADIFGASEATTVALALAPVEASANATASTALLGRQAMRIFTGARLPEGADAVVRQEDVVREGDTLLLSQATRAGADVRRRGELLSNGDVVARAGESVTPEMVGLMASQGMASAQVRRAPVVVLLTGGDEIVPVGAPLEPGQLYDSNAAMLAAMCLDWGIEDIRHVRMSDDESYLVGRLRELVEEPVVVVSAGGVSVGDHDHVRGAARRLGFERVFWGVAQRPGKPMYFGTDGASCWLGLPGNPYASAVCARLYLRALFARVGAVDPPRWLEAPAASPHPKGLTTLSPARWDIDAAGSAKLNLLDDHTAHLRLARSNALCVTSPDGSRRWNMY